ncbi:MAG: hypothetical protein GWO44_03700, partial [Thermoplasmata archaeon]|nr:hypothetical protein [Thermoplasmata archaeon]NIY02397.1 hypothetical protein [Thermoplasmata archaeon]
GEVPTSDRVIFNLLRAIANIDIFPLAARFEGIPEFIIAPPHPLLRWPDELVERLL